MQCLDFSTEPKRKQQQRNKNNFDFYALEGVIEKAPQFVKKWEIKKTEI